MYLLYFKKNEPSPKASFQGFAVTILAHFVDADGLILSIPKAGHQLVGKLYKFDSKDKAKVLGDLSTIEVSCKFNGKTKKAKVFARVPKTTGIYSTNCAELQQITQRDFEYYKDEL